LETLEDRMLLALGPQLIAIQPNSGELLNNGDVLSAAFQDLTFRFNEGQAIDPATLDGIRITRSGLDGGFGDANDVVIAPGFAGVNPDSPNEVIFRFADTLPDDLYRIDIFGAGNTPLRNLVGAPFNDGADDAREFKLNLGAQVVAVVPQPVERVGDQLRQRRDQIVVYFNNDDLLDTAASAENPDFYQLIFTNETVTNTDDVVHHPVAIDYSATTDTAVLTFAAPLDELSTGPGTYRLRIGTSERRPLPPQREATADDPGSSFDTAADLQDVFGFTFDLDAPMRAKSILISSEINPELFPLQFPGSVDEPGHRSIPVQSHFLGDGTDAEPGITTVYYNFKTIYGQDPDGNNLLNLITDQQKDLTRSIFELYGHYLGIQFVEDKATGPSAQGWVIATGDIRALSPTVPTGPGGVLGLSGSGTAIMDNAEAWNNNFGISDKPGRPSWFATAMHEIGHLLGLGHTDELPPITVMNDSPDLTFTTPPEDVFPGDNDIVHGQRLFRPESNDIDLYRFELSETGLFTAETTAERLPDSSLLDTVLTLYRQEDDGRRVLVSRNDDYFSGDSFVQMALTPGIYYVSVTSTGNTDFDPSVEGTGFGGTTQGRYDLRLSFRPEVTSSIVDADTSFDNGVSLPTTFDGDADGQPGGVYNFWFRTARPFDGTSSARPKTLFVDKSHIPSASEPVGTSDNPYATIPAALAAAHPNDIVRIVGSVPILDQNGQVDLTASPAYQIGIDPLGRSLSDGASLRIPKGVTVMVDAGAIFKLRRANLEVGSSSPTIDRSAGALQVLGAPHFLDDAGNLVLDGGGHAITGSVFFTSFDDESIGQDTNTNLDQTPQPGDWGGVIVRNDLDRAATPRRFDYEQEGIFLNYINHADIRYGGGNVSVGSVERVIAPIHMVDARPTVSFNTITASADAALSANPDSFEETNFQSPRFQETPFTSDYTRVGPDIHGNRLVRMDGDQLIQNTINGLFVRIDTPAGADLEKLTVAGRWDDTDIVHVVKENLIIQGTPGGPTSSPLSSGLAARLDARLAIDPGVTVKLDGARIETAVSAQLIAEGLDGHRIVFTSVLDDRFGAGGTFDTTSDGQQHLPAPGDWGGLYVGHTARASIDHARIAYGGGLTRVEGSFAGFNAVEIHQADVRIAHSLIEQNAYGLGGQSDSDRGGRGTNAAGAVFVIGAQPVLIDNTFRGTVGDRAAAITINVNALNAKLVSDWGRTTGPIDRLTGLRDNQGPLVHGNRLTNNAVNGMVVRGGTLTTESVWDDTDIVHVLYDEIDVPDFHTFGGLRLESSPTESLVVKAFGKDAGFTTTGRALDIADRIGGILHVIGQPGHPVVITSLADDTVGAGFDPQGAPQNDTDNGGRPLPTQPAGSFKIDLNLSPVVRANTRAVFALNFAARYWEQLLEDPITVVLDIDSVEVPPGVLAQTLSEHVSVDFSEVRSRLIQDAAGRPHESIVNQLPAFSDLNTIVPDDPANPFTVTDTMQITRANAKALGIPLDSLPATPSAYDPLQFRDARIEFSNDPVTWDYDRTDGVLPTRWDFAGVAVHEIGHALGFVSETSSVDRDLGDVTLPRDLQLNTLDLFRLPPGVGQTDFANAPRILDPTQGPHVFYDGGFFDPIDIPIPGLRIGDVPLSTGTNFGDGQQASHFKDDVKIGGVFLGMMDPTLNPGVEVTITSVDRQAFDLIGWDVVGGGLPGDWQGITLEQETHDRNVDIATEHEPRDVIAPGNNATPDTAQFLGTLAPGEKAGDDNQRLGFTVQGFLNSPGDLDVYSFKATAGTEVWFDIDRTASSLDSVVELLDARGNVLARSDNSLAEGQGTEPLFAAGGVQVHGLQKSVLRPTDYWTVNPKDAGMRVVLPGAPGAHTYHVRVRSSSPNLDNLAGGLTSGIYQLQLRLRDIDEFAGASVQFADIRYANNGVLIRGLPQHSPLTGETSEDGSANDTLPIATLDEFRKPGFYRQLIRSRPPQPGFPYELAFQDAQQLGNVLNTDRAAISVAGSLSGSSDIDWYKFDVNYDSVQNVPGFSPDTFAELIFDLDYADGLARPDTSLAIYQPIFGPADFYGNPELIGAKLIYTNQDSSVRDDLPAPLSGANTNDLSRGSVGKLDPLIGSVSLPTGTYLLAISSASKKPLDLEQFKKPLPDNPFIRVEPINSIFRIAEDHIGDPKEDPTRPTVFEPPQIPKLFADNSAVPFHLGDNVLFVTAGDEISTVNPFTGFNDTVVGKLARTDADGKPLPFNGKIGDFAFRSDGSLYAFSRGLTDATSGNYLKIDPGTAQVTGVGADGEITDDQIVTFEPDPADPTQVINSNGGDGFGVEFGAIAFPPDTIVDADIGNVVFAAGFRQTDNLGILDNVLYMLSANTGEATSGSGFPDRTGANLLFPAYTDKVERGILSTVQVGADPPNAVILTPDATEGTQRRLTDGVTFVITDARGAAKTYELNSGPEVTFNVDPAAGRFVRDGDTFTLDGTAFEFDTGAVLVMGASDGSAILDGATFTITDNQVVPVTRTFEFDNGTGPPVGGDHIAVHFSTGMDQSQLVAAVVSAINGVGGFNVQATPIGNRISLSGDSSLSNPTLDAGTGLVVEGATGGAGTLIHVEETSGGSQFVAAIEDAIGTADVAGNRISFPGADTGVFTQIVNRGVFVDQGADGRVAPRHVAIDFLVSDKAADIAAKMQAAIRTSSRAVGATVELLQRSKVTLADSPLTIAGEAPGGAITGMTFIGEKLFAVTDEGGLFEITNFLSNLANIKYIKSSAPLLGIKFAGLTAAPPDVEGGRFKDMMFGIDTSGNIYAFDTDGQLHDVFVDGQSSINTGISNPQGLAFSPLDQNLWNITSRRANDPGHDGGLSFHFGDPSLDVNGDGTVSQEELAANKNFDFAGGAHGSLVSKPFSLKGFSADDQPAIYFNYFLVTEGASGHQTRDSLRVFISDASRDDGRGQWHLLATNNKAELSVDLDPNDNINIDVQQLFDNSFEDVPDPATLQRNGVRDPHTDAGNTGDAQNPPRLPIPSEEDGVWRQARIALGDFAGSDELRIRFDFSTAGSMNVGDPQTVGSDLQAIDGSRLRDGDTFTIDGIDFEFEMGLTLNVAAGNAFRDNEILIVNNGADAPVTYEFTNGNPAPGHIAVPVPADATAREMARRLAAAITANGPVGVIPHLVDNRLNLENAVRVGQSDDPAIVVEGAIGSAGVPVGVHLEMSRQQVAQALRQSIADVFSNGDTDVIKSYDQVVRIIGHTIDDPGPLGISDQLPGDDFGDFFNKLRGQNNTSVTLPSDTADNNFIVPLEGPYVDDLIIGFASHGEAIRDLRPIEQTEKSCLLAANGDTPCTPTINGVDVLVGREFFVPERPDFTPTGDGASTNPIAVGEYQLEIRRAAEFTSNGKPSRTFSPTDRLSQSVTLLAPSGADLFDGQTFTLDDGLQSVTFEFDDRDIADGVAPDHVAIPFGVGDQDFVIAAQVRDAINSPQVQSVLAIKAAAPDGTIFGPDSANSQRVDLFGNVANDPVGIGFLINDDVGSGNRFRDQGQVMVTSSQISNSLQYGIVVEDGLRDLPTFRFFPRQQHAQFTTGDYTPHPGSARHLSDPNNDSLTSGVTITNNVIADNGQGGIHFGGNRNGFVIVAPLAGDANAEVSDTDSPDSPMTFAITDNNGLRVEFEFDTDNNVLPGNVPVSFTPNGGCPAVPGIGSCMPRYDPNNPDMVTALIRAISSTNLDVTLFQGKEDEIFVEGAKSIRGVRFGNARFDWFRPWYFAVPEGGLPLGRILNNTLVGKGGRLLDASDLGDGNQPIPDNAQFQDVGILVEDNAAPTLLNNVVVNFDTAVAADISSLSTIQGGTIFQGSNANLRNIDTGDFSVELSDRDSLFVDFVRGNYIPSANSPAIDSSIDSLEDRPEFVRIKAPLGIPVSSVLAPNQDVTGQLRVDDPNVEPPAGFGKNVFKDRGAIDRADFAGPSAVLLTPRDNDSAGNDLNAADTVVQLPDGIVLDQFSIQIGDGVEPADPRRGTGVDGGSVTTASAIVTRENLTTGAISRLVPDVDYTFSYDVTNNIIRLTPLAGIWETNNRYTIVLDNSFETGIRDMAGNPLKANQATGETRFTIGLGGIQDFGDAPDPTYPTLLASNGARHTIVAGFFLGQRVDAEINGQPTPDANGDGFDEDGVTFDSFVQVGSDTTVTVVASAPGMLDAWIDLNGDGDWNDAGEQIFASEPLTAGTNVLSVPIPVSAKQGITFARFRFSSAGGLAPTGPAPDGEVEDYQLVIQGNPWQNAPDPLQVTNNPNGTISPLDALVIINEINSRVFSDPVTGVLPVPPPIPPGSTDGVPFFYDVNGDGFATPLDALIVINFLNAQSASAIAARVDATADGGLAPATGAGPAVAAGGPVGGTVDAASGLFVSNPFAVPSRNERIGGVARRGEPPRAAAEEPRRLLDSRTEPRRRDNDEDREATREASRGTDRLETVVEQIAHDVGGLQRPAGPREQLFAELG